MQLLWLAKILSEVLMQNAMRSMLYTVKWIPSDEYSPNVQTNACRVPLNEFMYHGPAALHRPLSARKRAERLLRSGHPSLAADSDSCPSFHPGWCSPLDRLASPSAPRRDRPPCHAYVPDHTRDSSGSPDVE